MPVSLLVRAFTHCLRTSSSVALDLVRLGLLTVRSHNSLVAQNLFLRKHLALFQERQVKSRWADDATCRLMATLGRMFQPWLGFTTDAAQAANRQVPKLTIQFLLSFCGSGVDFLGPILVQMRNSIWAGVSLVDAGQANS
jgi:hypothetical protein